MRRAVAAGTGAAKKNQTCAPFPDRERSTAAGNPTVREVSTNAATSSAQDSSSKSAARNIIFEQWIDSDHVATLEVIEHHLIAYRDERLIRTLATLDPWLLADATHPLVCTGGRVSLSTRARGDPELGENLAAAPKEAAEQRDLLGSGEGWGRSRRAGCCLVRGSYRHIELD